MSWRTLGVAGVAGAGFEGEAADEAGALRRVDNEVEPEEEECAEVEAVISNGREAVLTMIAGSSALGLSTPKRVHLNSGPRGGWLTEIELSPLSMASS